MIKNIKNYTSSVPADLSILAIERTLIEAGATNIAKEYDAGKVKAIMFSVARGQGLGNQFFKLPARVEAITKAFVDGKRLTQVQRRNLEKQAERTAWKNVKEWVELQAIMIKLDQIEFMEAFFAHAWSINEGKTFFEQVKGSEFKQLSA